MSISRFALCSSIALCAFFAEFACFSVHGEDYLKFDAKQTTIVIAKDAPPSVKFAASELSRYLLKSTGNEYKIKNDSEIADSPKGKLILIGKSELTEKLELPKAFSPDSFLIKSFAPDTLVLIGDDRNIGNPRYLTFNYATARKGSLYAVYTLLEKYMGARWFWPGASGEVLQKKATLRVPSELKYASAPSFIWRHAWYYSRGKTKKSSKEIALWYIRNKMGISRGNPYSFQHSWGKRLTDKYYKTHPEYYSLVNGKRRPIGQYTQVCTSNPAVVDIFAEKIIAKTEPGIDDIISISPNDGNGFCECENCRKLDHQKLYTKEQGHNGLVYSDRVFKFVNQVSAKVAKARPKIKLAIFAYSYYQDPPKTIDKINDNVVLALTQINGHFNYPGVREKAAKRLAAWMKKFNSVIIRDYLGDYHYCEVVHPYTKIISEDLKFLHKNGTTGFYWESSIDFQTNHLNYYVAARLMWDVNLSREDILNDFYNKAYGKAAPFMRAYFEMMEKDFTSRDNRTKVMWGAAGIPQTYRKGTLKKAVELFAKAEQAVTDPAVKDRIAYDRQGLEYTILVCEFFTSCQKLTDIGLVVRMKDYIQRPDEGKTSKGTIVKLVRKAVEDKQKLAKFIKTSNPVNLISMLPHQDKTFKWFETIDRYEKMFLSNKKSKGEVTLMSLEWKFKTDPEKKGVSSNWHKADFDDSKWKLIKTTTFWEKQGYPNYDGDAWYRLKYKIDANAAGKKIILHCGAVDENCDVYVNGTLVGKHRYDAEKNPSGWKTPVEFDITKFVIPGKVNSFAIMVNDTMGGGGLWKSVFLKMLDK